MNDTRATKKDKNQHIQVFVRVRPTNNAEKSGKSTTVVDVTSSKEVVVRERPQDKLTKKFTFDTAFGPSSKQVEVYNAVVRPLLDEVLAGYNCTVFAYGQTGTGKTFTMEGAGNDPTLHWQSDTQAGIIPRSLSHLFDELRTLDAQEYTVRVSFLELYNEELFDLLSPSDDASKIRLYEDASRKGSVIIHGLEEVTVHNKSEVYKILEKGSEKRQTAATLMNAHSSRSHTVFAITVHIKENTVDGEELLKTGKLNLVDLAGSENVGRSGAVDRRAREAGNINQSLLTLGRVITALVERAPHIPYRESKLTRLLQESLGGRTKTSIIATVSPASVNLEETLSTLDYAHRAKNITNRPEINQKLSKKALLKEYTEEIERLRRDLLATRERNGVYLAHENYNDMQATIECQGKEIEEKINHIKALEETMFNKERIFNDLQQELEQRTNVLFATKEQLDYTKTTLESTKDCLQNTALDRDIHKHLVNKHAKTEKILYSQAQTLLKVADTATDDTYKLHDKIFRKKRVEDENENLGYQFRENIAKRFEDMENNLSNYTRDFVQFCLTMKNQLHLQTGVNRRVVDSTVQLSKNLDVNERVVVDKLQDNIDSSYDEYKQWIETQVQNAAGMTHEQSRVISEISSNLAPRIQQLCENKIAENLRSINEQYSKKFDNLLMYVKDSTDTFCETLQESQNSLLRSFDELVENIETTNRTQGEILKNRNDFLKAFEGLWHHYNNLNAQEESSNAVISNCFERTGQICKDIRNQADESCSKGVKSKRDIEIEIHRSVDTIKNNISTDMEKNWTIAEGCIKESKKLCHEIQTGLGSNCEALNSYKNLVQRNAEEMHKTADSDRAAIISSTNAIRKIVSDASVNLVEYVEEQQHKSETAVAEIGRKFENQGVKSTEWSNSMTADLRTTQHQLDKFIIEDLRKDVPTGSTPAKRTFEYPRKLVVTSPHERIIKRFRETRIRSEESDEEHELTILSSESTIKRQSGSPNHKGLSPVPLTKGRSTSTPNTETKKTYTDCLNTNSHNLIKSASTSDISAMAMASFDSSARSESEINTKNNNKENNEDDFAKPGRKIPPRRFGKLKSTNRRVLGTYN